jgi:hypothetical protein
MLKHIFISGLLLLSGCHYPEAHACYEKYPSPHAVFGLAELSDSYKDAVNKYAGGDEQVYSRNWDSLIKACINPIYGR